MAANRETFQFHGRGGEYFRIWIVNVTLTLLTLGIYSAWAKVRRNRYIYGNLELAGSRFDYTARPLVILRGRLIALALLAVYLGGQFVFPPAVAIVGLVLFVGTPWLIVRARMFNLRYTRYRNVSFGFAPVYGEAYKVIYLYAFLSMLTFGLLVPYAHYRRNRMLVGNARFGNQEFSMESGSGPFYAAYALAAVAGLLALVPLTIVTAQLAPAVPEGGTADSSAVLAAAIVPLAVMALIYGAIGQFLHGYVLRATTNATRIGDTAQLGCSWSVGGFVGVALTNIIAIIVSAGLLLPWARMRMLRYQLNQTWLDVPEGLDNVVAEQADAVSSLGDEVGDVFDLDVGL